MFFGFCQDAGDIWVFTIKIINSFHRCFPVLPIFTWFSFFWRHYFFHLNICKPLV
uniref:Uncharacterized protein n=1 Tax=uncultured marine virus TaxID=186617 RepID=A0A0F7L7N4_9VIRU|nr:hypothetical protein [uncultured marine virus]